MGECPVNSQEIVKLFNAKAKGQQLLFEDCDYTLRHTEFIPSENIEKNQEILIHWWMHVHNPCGRGNENTEENVFRSWSSAVQNNFKYARPHGRYTETIDGKYQEVVDIACTKNAPLIQQLKELELWLPHVKESYDENFPGKKRKYVSIFEHTCSAYGCYSLSIYNDSEIALDFIKYRRHSVLNVFKTLADAVDYVRLNHWYLTDEKQY